MRLKSIVLPIVGSMMIMGSTLYANVPDKIMNSLQKVDLQKKQNDQVQQFQEEQKQEIQNSRKNVTKGRIFSKEGFDKQYFIQRSEEMAKIHIEANANFIEKIFSMLNNKQKVELLKAMQNKN